MVLIFDRCCILPCTYREKQEEVTLKDKLMLRWIRSYLFLLNYCERDPWHTISRSLKHIFSLSHAVKINIHQLSGTFCSNLWCATLGVHGLAFIIAALDPSPALEANAFVLSTSALVSVNALAQAEHLEAGILWPGPGSLPSSHTCHRASAFPVSGKPFLISVSEIATIW